MESIDLPAGTVHYRDLGPADGRPVVFVHGFLVDDTLWSDVPERLAAARLPHARADLAAGRAPTAMRPDADLSPRGVARIVLSFLEALDLTDVVLVGSDTGGAVCQFVLDEDPSRIGRLVLTDCDAFDVFPPFPFNLLFRLARHPRPRSSSCSRCGPRVPAQQPAGLRLAGAPRPHPAESRCRGSRRTSPTPAYAATSPRSPGGGRPRTWPTSATRLGAVRPPGADLLGACRPVLQDRPGAAARGAPSRTRAWSSSRTR